MNTFQAKALLKSLERIADTLERLEKRSNHFLEDLYHLYP